MFEVLTVALQFGLRVFTFGNWFKPERTNPSLLRKDHVIQRNFSFPGLSNVPPPVDQLQCKMHVMNMQSAACRWMKIELIEFGHF